MITKHFVKTLFTFIGMIAIGLIGVFLISYFDENQKIENAGSSEVVDILE